MSAFSFGSGDIRELFVKPLESAGVLLNHGSYGLAPALVRKKRLE